MFFFKIDQFSIFNGKMLLVKKRLHGKNDFAEVSKNLGKSEIFCRKFKHEL